MKISVYGTGYVGLVTGVHFSEMGNDVIFLLKDGPKQRRPDISKALEFLAPWRPTVNLELGLHKMINWLSDQLES